MILKFNKENIKQISLMCVGIVLIGIGYLNYSLDFKVDEVKEMASRSSNEINFGDVELVNTEPIEETGMIVSNDNLVEEELIEKSKEEISTIKESNYFQETRLERDKMYSEMIETYENLIKSELTPNDQKAIAAQEISNITNIKNGIMIAENLIKNKGFEDVIILVNNDTASVVVKSYNLNQEEISKIQNIIQRELKIETKNINISNKF